MKNTQKFSILFWLNKQRSKNEESPIYVRISIDGKRAEIATKYFLNPKFWHSTSMTVKSGHPNSNHYNTNLANIKSELNRLFLSMAGQSSFVSVASLKNLYLGIEEKPKYKSILDAFEYHNFKMAEMVKVGKASPATHIRYKITQDKTVAFMNHCYKCSDKPLSEVRMAFVTEFEHYLLTVDKLASNTAHKYIKNFKKVMNMAVGLDWIPSHPLKQFKCSYTDPEREVLSIEELNTIMAKELTCERLKEVRDVFIFSCYTGFAYSEIYKFSSDALTMGIDGNYWLSTIRGKTGRKESVPLLPIPLKITSKYRAHPYCSRYSKLLPVNSNQCYNAYLKELMAICGINKRVTTHTARHTFATTITLANGVPMETVMSMLGHSNIRTTQIYSKVVQKKVSEDMCVLREKFAQIDPKEQKEEAS